MGGVYLHVRNDDGRFDWANSMHSMERESKLGRAGEKRGAGGRNVEIGK